MFPSGSHALFAHPRSDAPCRYAFSSHSHTRPPLAHPLPVTTAGTPAHRHAPVTTAPTQCQSPAASNCLRHGILAPHMTLRRHNTPHSASKHPPSLETRQISPRTAKSFDTPALPYRQAHVTALNSPTSKPRRNNANVTTSKPRHNTTATQHIPFRIRTPSRPETTQILPRTAKSFDTPAALSYNLQAITRAWVAKLADALDSGSSEQYVHVGSSPVPRTKVP